MTIRKAASYQFGLCDDPKCKSIHFELCDEDGEVFARATIGIEDVPKVTERFRDMAYFVAAVRKEPT